MNNARRLAIRREVLVARSSLQRLELAQAMGSLRESVRWPRPIRLVRSAVLAFAVLKLARSFLRWRAGA